MKPAAGEIAAGVGQGPGPSRISSVLSEMEAGAEAGYWDEVLMYSAIGVASVAVIASGYFLYRKLFPVGAVQFQGRKWHFHDEDKVWAGRMIVGESGTDATRNEAAAVLWSVAARWVTKPAFQGMTYTQVIRGFSQPVNPIWASNDQCNSSGRGCCGNCTSAQLSRRAYITSLPWTSIPASIRGYVEDFMRGALSNPIPQYNNFAAAGYVSGSNSELEPVTIGGNTFIRDPGSLPGEVRIV
jgi:hypothetical protein